MDALSLLSSDRILVNPVDRAALDRMLSQMKSLQVPLSASPLSDPQIVASRYTGSIGDSIRRRQIASGSTFHCSRNASDAASPDAKHGANFEGITSPALGRRLARTVKFAQQKYPIATAQSLQPALRVKTRVKWPMRSCDEDDWGRKTAAQMRVLTAYPNLQHAGELCRVQFSAALKERDY